MILSMADHDLRSIEVQIEIAAPAEAVWRALIEPVELVRWFPVEARVIPGVDGSMWLSWGAPIVADSRIVIWKPNRHLRTVETRPLGVLLQPGGTYIPPRTLDYYIEPFDGKTVLRLMHSGFGSGSYWEELCSAVQRGWEFQLRSLRHYLERHAGTDRYIACVRRSLHRPVKEVWNRFMGPEGLLGAGLLEDAKEGDDYSIRTATGDGLEGVVLIHDPPKQFAVTVTNWSDSLFRIYLVEAVTGVLEANLWLGTYRMPRADVAAFEQRWKSLLEQSLD
jgi:hypothetical protein